MFRSRLFEKLSCFMYFDILAHVPTHAINTSIGDVFPNDLLLYYNLCGLYSVSELKLNPVAETL